MKEKPLPSQEILLKCLRYCRTTGRLWWRKRPADTFLTIDEHKRDRRAAKWNARFSGKRAFTTPQGIYRCGSFNGASYRAHRIIWRMVTGDEPHIIDHEDHKGSNNRWRNLRDTSHAGNARNKRLGKRNLSGAHGVHCVRMGYVATFNSSHLGTFKSFDEALSVRKAAEAANGYHPNHGNPEGAHWPAGIKRPRL